MRNSTAKKKRRMSFLIIDRRLKFCTANFLPLHLYQCVPEYQYYDSGIK